MLDEQKVQDWIDSLRNDLTERIHDKRVNDELETPGYYRLNGGMNFLTFLEADVKAGHLNADVPEPTPVKDIKVKTQNIVRRNDPETSFKAAISQTSEKRQRIYELIHLDLRQESRGMTDDQLTDTIVRIQGHKFSPSGIRTRRSEMVKAGWVRDSGKTRDSFAGHPATVWELVPQKKN